MEETFVIDDSGAAGAAGTKAPAAPAVAPADLSIAVARAVDKQPGEHVRVRKVGRDTYRCNWMAVDTTRAGGDLQSLTTYRIRDSRFLRATKAGKDLVIEDLTVRKTLG